jgi:hypothetical protein
LLSRVSAETRKAAIIALQERALAAVDMPMQKGGGAKEGRRYARFAIQLANSSLWIKRNVS